MFYVGDSECKVENELKQEPYGGRESIWVAADSSLDKA
jgi:hypothetical protein